MAKILMAKIKYGEISLSQAFQITKDSKNLNFTPICYTKLITQKDILFSKIINLLSIV